MSNKMNRFVLFFILWGSTYFDLSSQPVIDYDGNVYTTVTIGNQNWLVENLKVTHFRNGDPVPLVTNDSIWPNLNTPAYCWFLNDTSYKSPYGALYNWYTTIDDRNIAPPGCHVPTEGEWAELVEYLGGVEVAGGKMKETGTTHWWPPNTGATNSSGFTGLPGGSRLDEFHGDRWTGNWWSCTYDAGGIAHARGLYYNDEIAYFADGPCVFGFSIRCLKNPGIGIYDPGDQTNLIIYPNPSNGFIKIEFSPFPPETNVTMYDLSGKTMIQRNISRDDNKINIESLPKGIYFLRITDNKRIIQRKIIKL
jgi:uncharacterized protein (TIGR02145 family)